MKRLLTVLLMVAMSLSAYPAFAAVNNTPHDFLGTTFGRCGTCHVPHAAALSSRLWRDVLPVAQTKTGDWAHSSVGALCGYCHNGGNGVVYSNTGGISTNSGNDHKASPAYLAESHGRDITRLTGAPLSHAVSASGTARPYMVSGKQPEADKMECTSCHNPHNEGANAGETGIRPFLRPGAVSATKVSGVCNDCHDDRYTDTVGSTTNHPVLIAYNPTIGSDPRQFIAAVAAMNTPVGTSAWSLGGKFEGNIATAQAASTSELIGCQSCHSIHKAAAPANADGTAYTGGSPRQLLAVTYTNSAVCEGCHSARGNSGSVGTLGGDHPYDAALAGVMVLDGALWTGGGVPANATDKGSNGGAICTSCHKAHITTGDGVLNIRRAGAATWCTSCHTSVAPAAHHSNSTQLPGSNINCSDCHDSTGAKAHNGFGYVFKYASSGGCETCHSGDPVTAVGGVGEIPTPHLTAKAGAGTAVSHYMGTFTKDTAKGINPKIGRWSTDVTRGGRISAYLKKADGSALTSDQSCYNATAGASATTVIRCESCHSVLGNIGATTGLISASSGWTNNLLLQDYRDDSANEPASRGINSDLCIGCHNQLGDGTAANLGTADGVVGLSLEKNSGTVPPGMHPMTNWNITRAVDAGFTGAAARLITGTAAQNTVRDSYADASGAPTFTGGIGTNGTSYPGANVMDCDSCHRPHLANLNWNVTNITAGHSNPVPVILEDSGASDFAPLCQDCHAY